MISVNTQNITQIQIGQGLLEDPSVFSQVLQEKIFIITDATVAQHHLDRLLEGLEPLGQSIHTLLIGEGERHKSLETVASLYSALAEFGASRSDSVVAFGGGVVGDLAGFVASTFKRGMNFVQIPTTLLAQVDAAIGGKTGFNLSEGKNLVGTFYEPTGIICDVTTLETLPDDVFRCGLAEVVKYGLISDTSILDLLESSGDRVFKRIPSVLIELVKTCYECKNKIILEDMREELGLRELLNFGHTIGHAIEMASEFRLTHGQAVSIGMVLEAECAIDEGIAPPAILDRIVCILSSLGLPTELPSDLREIDLASFLLQDKKLRGGRIRAPLLVELGRAEVREVRPPFFLKKINGGKSIAYCNA